MAAAAVGRPALAPSASTEWHLRTQRLPLFGEPLVMGILNVTPDSFSDGGLHATRDAAVRRAEAMVAEGAHLLDVGGESTRPGSRPPSAEEELSRVIPVVEALAGRVRVPISVDTRRASVARAALEAGAEVINDVSSLRDPEMAGVVARAGAGIVLMHMRGEPATMQDDPTYEDVVREVGERLESAVRDAEAAGIGPGKIVVDPGIGFGKTAAHNLTLLARLDEIVAIAPVMIGVSRKGFIGALLGGVPAAERSVGTAAACVVGLLNGARIFRVHDVRLVREALTVAEAIRAARRP